MILLQNLLENSLLLHRLVRHWWVALVFYNCPCFSAHHPWTCKYQTALPGWFDIVSPTHIDWAQVRGSAPPVSDGRWEPLSHGRWESRWDGTASRVSSASQGPLYLRSDIKTLLHNLSRFHTLCQLLLGTGQVGVGGGAGGGGDVLDEHLQQQRGLGGEYRRVGSMQERSPAKNS